MNNGFITIIIPTKDRETILYKHLNIAHQELKELDYEIIIINDSKTSQINVPKHLHHNTRCYDNPNQGVASARNYGAKLANSQNLIFIDDDMIVNKEAILKAINFLNSTEKKTYNANWAYKNELLNQISKTQFGRYLIKYNFTSLQGWNGNSIHWVNNTLIKAEGITSQFFAIKKLDFEFVGGYNDKFPFAGFEDYELSVRLKELNIINYIDTSVLIYHNEIDRIDPQSWLKRQKRGAQTRKVAVGMGFSELKINYNLFKRTIYFLLSIIKPFLMFCLKIIPNINSLDRIYFKLINLLLGVNIYEGFHSSK